MRITNVNFARKIKELTLKHSNLPESYVRRCTEIVEYESPRLPQYRRMTVKRTKTYYDVHRPWTMMFQKLNAPLANPKKVWVEPVKDWCFFKGDRVEVLNGKDTGKHGIVISIIQERNWVIVRGLNMHLSKNQATGITSLKEAPLLINREVALVDPYDSKPTKIEWRYDEKGKKVRVSTRTGAILPIPIMEEETHDYVLVDSYKEGKKDTADGDVCKVTFVPLLRTFEMDIMDEMKIKEDRIPGKTYWY